MPYAGSTIPQHPAYSREDTFTSAETYLKAMAALEDYWGEEKSLLLMYSVTMLYRSTRQGYDTDISAFSAAMNIPRSSAHRLLNKWEQKHYVTLERAGRKTIIRLTASTLDTIVKFFDEFSCVFNRDSQ